MTSTGPSDGTARRRLRRHADHRRQRRERPRHQPPARPRRHVRVARPHATMLAAPPRSNPIHCSAAVSTEPPLSPARAPRAGRRGSRERERRAVHLSRRGDPPMSAIAVRPLGAEPAVIDRLAEPESETRGVRANGALSRGRRKGRPRGAGRENGRRVPEEAVVRGTVTQRWARLAVACRRDGGQTLRGQREDVRAVVVFGVAAEDAALPVRGPEPGRAREGSLQHDDVSPASERR